MPRILRVAALSALALVVASIAELPASMQELEIATSVSMLEGPTVDAEGNVYFTDILMQRIMRFSKNGEFSVFREKSNVANGLVIDPQGRLVAAEGAASPTAERSGMKTGGIPRVTRTDLKTGRMEILADTYDGKPLSGPNDVTIDGRGRLYFTDSSGAAVYRIDAPGKLVADPCRARRAAAERHPDFARRSDPLRRRSQWRRGRCAVDPRLRSAPRWHGEEHARALQLLSGKERGRDERRYPGQPLRGGGHAPRPRHGRDARHEVRRLRDFARRESC